MFLSTLSVALAPQAHAGCKVEAKTDPFTGVSQRAVGKSFGHYIWGKVEYVSSTAGTTLAFPLIAISESNVGIEGGSTAALALKDGTVVELLVAANAAPVTDVVGSSIIVTRRDISGPVTDAQLGQLAASPTTAIKVTMGGAEKVFETNNGIWTKIAKATQANAACMMANKI